MTAIEFSPNEAQTEAITAHVLWITVGLSCEGDSVAMTSATNPSLEDIITGAIPGMPKVVIHRTCAVTSSVFLCSAYTSVAAIRGSFLRYQIRGSGSPTS